METDKSEKGSDGTDMAATHKPLVSIVLATYNPIVDWLRDQLKSLENQTYRPLELIVLDDCSTKVPLDQIEECVADCIRSIPYQVFHNEENFGSTKTFEKLTKLASGEYIAYCDQDDVWHEDKIEILQNCFSKENISLAYSDVRIIDQSGKSVVDSITELRKRHCLHEGPCLTEKLLIQNFVIGCTMLVRAEISKKALPFIEGMVHDHYLALTASMEGEFALCNKPLVFYRIHEDNQTNTLKHVYSKRDYYQYKIKAFLDRLNQLEFLNIRDKVPRYSEIRKWAEARDAYYHRNFRQGKYIWKYREFESKISLFELSMIMVPDFAFRYAINVIKRGKI